MRNGYDSGVLKEYNSQEEMTIYSSSTTVKGHCANTPSRCGFQK